MVEHRKAPSVRTESGRVIRDALRHLDEVVEALSRHASQQEVATALDRIGDVREALMVLAREGTKPRPAKASTSPALVRRIELEPVAGSSLKAREFCRERCELWSLPPGVTATATDVTSELVANAAGVAQAPVVLALELRPDQLLISVWDDSPGRPRVLPYRPGVSERGVGLRLVKQLSSQWGWTEHQGGKWVWARLVFPLAGEPAPGAIPAPRPRRPRPPAR